MSRRNGAPKTIPLQILAAATKHAYRTSARDGMIFEYLLETAARNTEARLLLVGHVWRNNDVVLAINLPAELAKGGKPRALPLSGPFRMRLREYILKHRSDAKQPLIEEPLFPSSRGRGHLTRRGLARIVKAHLAAAGWDATPHAIRHTAATELLRVSNARVVQLILGHSRLDTIMIYTHPSHEELVAAQERRHAAPLPDPQEPAYFAAKKAEKPDE